MVAYERRAWVPLPVARAVAVLAVVACDTSPDSGPPPVRAALDEVFTTEAVIQLGEDPRDSISVPGTKLYEGIPLPEDWRVLGGGRYLYVLQDRGFPPWRITKLKFREPPPDG